MVDRSPGILHSRAPWSYITLAIIGFVLATSLTEAKIISPTVEKGENKVFIRVDGLACYFCAYGLERFFKQSGRVAWYDMKMDEGIIEVGFIKSKPVLDIQTLRQYVYDAGFSPREIRAEFVGRLIRTNGGYSFEVTETNQSFPVEINDVVQNSKDLFGQEVILIARAKETQEVPLRLVAEVIRPRGYAP